MSLRWCPMIHQITRRTRTNITDTKNTYTYTSSWGVEQYQVIKFKTSPKTKTNKDNNITAATLLVPFFSSSVQSFSCTISQWDAIWLQTKLIHRMHQHTPWNSCFSPAKCGAFPWPIITHSTVFRLGSGRSGVTAMSCNYKSKHNSNSWEPVRHKNISDPDITV